MHDVIPCFSLGFLLALELFPVLWLPSSFNFFSCFFICCFFSFISLVLSYPKRLRNLPLVFLLSWFSTMMCSTARRSFSIGDFGFRLYFLKSQIGIPYVSTCFSAFKMVPLRPSISSYFSRKKSLSKLKTLTLFLAIAVNKNPSLKRMLYMPMISPWTSVSRM